MKSMLAVTGLAVLAVVGFGPTGPAQSLPGTAKSAQPASETVHLIDSIDGPALYKAYCAVCHGADARGNGPMAASLKTAPPDLTRIATQNHDIYPTTRVERIISGEEQLPGGHGTRAMPVWGPIFSQIAWDQDLGRLRVHNLSAYIGRLQAR